MTFNPKNIKQLFEEGKKGKIFIFFFLLDSTSAFKFNFTHSDTNDLERASYKIGDEIKFHITFNSGIDSVKAVLQRCWSTSDGSDNVYNLINNR